MRQHRPIATNGGDALHVGALLVLISLLLLNPLFADAQPSPKPSTSDDPNNNSDNGYGSFGTTKFNPSMAIVIVVLISAFFFLGFFSIYIRQCGGGDRGGSVRGAAARSRRQQRGLDPDLLVTFPTLVYSEVKGLKIGKGSLECAVCLSEFEDDETLRLLPRCSHVFHHDCIDAWLASHVTCPVCRSNLAETPTAAAESASDPAPEETAVEIAPPEQVAISISAGEGGDGDDREQEMAELARIGSRMRSRSRFPRFPRSHSTGHSTGHSMALAQEKGNLERFTLRLPDDVKKEIVSGGGRFQRAASMRAFPTEGSTRRGYRGTAEGSARGGRSIRLGRSDRWPSFLARTISARFSAFASGKRWESEGSFKKGDGEGSSKGKMSSVRAQFDCLGAGGGGDNEPAARV